MLKVTFFWAFVVGGLLCAVAQLVVDKTSLSAADTMVLFVSLGAVASALGLYEPLAKFAGAGATIPLTSFGHALVKGSLAAAGQKGTVGLLMGGLQATALALAVAIAAGYLMALLFNPRG